MPAFKDEHIILIAPGSQTTLAQLGLPESFTPARLRLKSRMFPAEAPGEWEPYKVRRKTKKTQQTNGAPPAADPAAAAAAESQEPEYEEDPLSDEGAVWPIKAGRIVDWDCFFALMHHVHNLLNAPFHTPILLIAQPCWTTKDYERLTQFFFEKFKTPGFAIVDAAQASCYAYSVHTALVVDVGYEKADVTTVVEHLVDDTGRARAIPGCGGHAMTQRLVSLLGSKGFNEDMCEQLKKSPICEILPPGVPLPGTTTSPNTANAPANAASSTTGADGPGPAQRTTQAAMAGAPRGPGVGTDVGTEGMKGDEDNEGVLDVASIVTGGKMNEYLERKEREKVEKNAAKKKGAAADQNKPTKLRNAERDKNTFFYEDSDLLKALRGANLDAATLAEKSAAMDEGPKRAQAAPVTPIDQPAPSLPAPTSADPGAAASDPAASTQPTSPATASPNVPRRELTVGIERFQPHSGDILLTLTDAIHRTVMASPNPQKRQDLWENLIVVGNGARVRGFREALLHTLSSRFLISPSSASMLTGDIPSSFTPTPGATGTSTPVPPGQMPLPGPGVNPLLYAATTANHPHPMAPGSMTPNHLHSVSAAPSQSPTSIRTAKLPEYFPEWKDVGTEEAHFLGAQVAAKVIFVADVQGGSAKGFMSRSDYNESGPGGIGEFLF